MTNDRIGENPYAELTGGEWLKGNLHTHTNRSDGRREMQAVVDDYAERGYDFLMISDHDKLSTLEDFATLDAHGMVLISGNEISRDGVHMLHVNASKKIEPHKNRQQVIDEANADQGLVIVNHPDWAENHDHISIEALQALSGYAGIEIFNGSVNCVNDMGSAYAVSKWDMLLSMNPDETARRGNIGGRRVWGYATDDSHQTVDVGLGWTTVYVSERSPEAICEALRSGRFYASTGVVIEAITVTENRVRVEAKNADRIVAIKQGDRRVAIADAPVLEVEFPEDARFLRFECMGRGEAFAWTQPIFGV